MRDSVAILLAVLTVTSMVVAPVSAQTASELDGKVSPFAKEIDGLIGFSVPDEVVDYDNKPGYFVVYEPGEFSSLDTWINESDDRTLIDHDNGSRRVLLSAPPPDVHGGFAVSVGRFPVPSLVDGLASKSYVESVDVNIEVSYADPVTSLDNRSDYSKPAPNVLVPGAWTPEGVAFAEDANRTDLDEARTLIGADNVTETGNGTVVGVIDTGANVGDGEIYGNGSSGSRIRIDAAKDFVNNETVNVSASNPDWSKVEDGDGHGSWVASAVAANVTGTTHDGVAPDANLTIAKALDDDGSGDTQDIVEAINWTESQGADVIVMSLGSPIYSPTMAQALRDAVQNGSVSVAVIAAGNSRTTLRYVSSPSDVPMDGVVTVAASNTPENVAASKSAYFSNVGPDPARDFSNRQTLGEGPDVAAPGMRVVAPTFSSTDGIRQNTSLSGTSMATPLVGGAYALALEATPSWQNTTAVADWTANTSRAMPEAGTTEVGAGMIAVDHLIDQETVDGDQAGERTADAVARDEANTNFGANRVVQILAGARDVLP